MRCAPEALAAALADLDSRSLRRTRRVNLTTALSAASAAPLLNFCSNDYLGLAQHPKLAQAMAMAAQHYGAGSGASHLVCGHGPEHERLERELADFVGRERALLFSTGYMANLGVVAALAERHDLILQDRLNHASLLDAARLSGANRLRYAHADATAAEAARAGTIAAHALFVTDGVFSMDGDLAPLPELAAAAARRQDWLIVDDAHGLGVVGASGRGSCEHFGLTTTAVPVLIGTLGKALGSFGAFVAGSRDLIDFLMQRARTYIYTTALPQPVAAATRAALQVLREEPWRRTRVHELTARFRANAARRGIALLASSTPIQPIVIGDAPGALRVSEQLRAAGFWVTAIRPPTVPEGTARLRVTLSAAHRDEDVDALTTALASALDGEAANQ